MSFHYDSHPGVPSAEGLKKRPKRSGSGNSLVLVVMFLKRAGLCRLAGFPLILCFDEGSVPAELADG